VPPIPIEFHVPGSSLERGHTVIVGADIPADVTGHVRT
jgi:hypothetical protein